MKAWVFAPLLAGALIATSAVAQPQGRIVYPATRTVEQVDTYHGVAVRDPYRWLEQDVRTTPEVAAWVEAQNRVTRAYLDALPGRARIASRLRELWNYDQFSVPDIAGDRIFYEIQRGDQNQAALYVQEGMNGERRLLLDPNTWSSDGATGLAGTQPSPDGSHLIYSIVDGGSDWRVLRVIDVATGRQLDDEVRWAKFTNFDWAPDGRSFYYARYPEPAAGEQFTALNFNHAIYRHVLGTPQSADTLVYSRPDSPRHLLGNLQVTDDGRWLVVSPTEGSPRNEVVLINLRTGAAQPLLTGFDAQYSFIGIGIGAGGRLMFLTNKDAPRGRVIAVDPRRPAPAHWRVIIAEGEHPLEDAQRIGNVIIGEYLVDVKSEVRRFRLDGRLIDQVELPGLGSVLGFNGGADDSRTFYRFASFNRPDTIFAYDTRTGRTTDFLLPITPFNANDFVVEQVFYNSKDGTRVPMFIAHRRDVTPNGRQPTLLYAYGGFNAAQMPGFQVQRLQWMEMGGVFVLANVRGGSEYGEAWHEGGMRLNRQNVYDDFIAAAEHLISSGWTDRDHLAIQGRSNGGLLIGAVLNQRPDLFAAALPMVGVMDMVRFNQFSAGRFWTGDYGDPADEAQFRALYAQSPYHNIRDGVDYPPMLTTTADTDDRVVPGHTFKYIARAQAAQGGSAPAEAPRLVRIQTRAGHATGRSTDQLVEETADMWAFIAHHIGLEPPAR